MENHIDTTGAAASLQTYTDPYPGKPADELVWRPCGRCDGDGIMEHYRNTFGGVCFECNGTKGQQVTVKAERARESGRVSRENKRTRDWIKMAERHNEQLAAAEAAYPALAKWGELMERDTFLSDLWAKAFDYELTEKQIAAAAKTAERLLGWEAKRAAEDAEREANKRPAPEGKLAIEGVVKSVKSVESGFGYHETRVWKMVVEAEGYAVWATIPQALLAQLDAEGGEDYNAGLDELRGRRVQFTATLERSQRDDSFAFAKRPSKVKLLAK